MPEPADFEQLADAILSGPNFRRSSFGQVHIRAIAAQLRQVWNARPVPRCDQCRFWKEDGELSECLRIDERPSKAFIPEDEYVEHLRTAADFGCVQWEAKS